jgi:hypothetical protein
MFGDKSARVGLVAGERVAEASHHVIDDVRKLRRATGLIAITDHDVRSLRFVRRDSGRWHRVAIHKDDRSEGLMGLVDQPSQRAMIGFVEQFDPAERIIHAETLTIYFLAVADHARDSAETTRDPHRSRIGEARQPPGEHSRIELVRFAVYVNVGAGKVDPDHRKAGVSQATDQFIHERIF